MRFYRPARRGWVIGAALGVAAVIAAALVAFRSESRDDTTAAPLQIASPPAAVSSNAAGETASCVRCHAPIVEAYGRHGMSRSIGPVEGLTPGAVTNPLSHTRYVIETHSGVASLTATMRGGGTRRQRIVGRIGAGIFDRSWITTELDETGRADTGRFFFAPVETISGRGLQLSPFELHERSPGVDMPLTYDCLTCHTLDRAAGAATRFPAHHLGAIDAFRPLTCGACHGDVEQHAQIMSGKSAAPDAGLGVVRIGLLSAGAQRDICARCHLQGDARIDLVDGKVDRNHPIAGQIPVLVPSRAQTDFRFVGQVERLALSACFKSSPAMTCTTCHDPHTAVRAQGVESFERACIACHQTVGAHSSRTTGGCVGCHVRRSQPFDLPHVKTADHYIRRQIEPPQQDVPHRQFAAVEGALTVYDDGRLRPVLETAAGGRWVRGVTAISLLTMGRFADAARHFAAFPPPGSEAARVVSTPAALAPLESSATFHTMRGLALLSAGQIDDARRAFTDAIAIDPAAAAARMARARILLDAGDLRGAGLDTEAVIRAYPRAEQPWDLHIEIARRDDRPDLALSAADASTRLWPFNASTWAIVAALAEQRGQTERARHARERARTLSPSAQRSRSESQVAR